MIIINGKLQHPTLAKTTAGRDPSGMKIWVTSPGKEPQPVEVLTKDKDNVKWAVEEIVINNSYDHMTSYRNGDCN